jgi:chromosome segregation ATPase
MNDGRKQEIESVAQQLHMEGEFVPAIMLTDLLAEVERLTAERDFHVAQADALAAEWQRENDKLNACRAERDALAGQLAQSHREWEAMNQENERLMAKRRTKGDLQHTPIVNPPATVLPPIGKRRQRV